MLTLKVYDYRLESKAPHSVRRELGRRPAAIRQTGSSSTPRRPSKCRRSSAQAPGQRCHRLPPNSGPLKKDPHAGSDFNQIARLRVSD